MPIRNQHIAQSSPWLFLTNLSVGIVYLPGCGKMVLSKPPVFCYQKLIQHIAFIRVAADGGANRLYESFLSTGIPALDHNERERTRH